MSCGVGRRRGSDPALLWLWRRLEATAPIGPLAWEPAYAAGVALEKTKKKKLMYILFGLAIPYLEIDPTVMLTLITNAVLYKNFYWKEQNIWLKKCSDEWNTM